MAESEIQHPDGRLEHPEVQYEPQDIRFGWILALILVAGLIVSLQAYLVWRLYWLQQGWQATAKESPYPLGPPLSQTPPAEPRLEEVDRRAGVQTSNTYVMQAAEEKVLHSFGETAEKGFVHVPIEQAIRQTAGQLPVRKQSPPEASQGIGLLDEGEPNSGRIYRGESP